MATHTNPDQRPRRFIKLPKVKDHTSLSTSEIYRRIAAGTFPIQVVLGPKSVSVRPTHLPDPISKGNGVHLFKWTPFLAPASGSPCANETLTQNPLNPKSSRSACNLALQ